jgi:UDP-GlcNAc:undecaprenyl-phosphate GlcNAc-1-phosphate transferase
VSLRRILEGKSPFRPDRGHVHHILMMCGLSSRQSLICLGGSALCCALVGLMFEQLQVPDYLSLLAFVLVFILWLRISIRIYHRYTA